MIHSHWLCYKYFYGSVFLSFFLSFFPKGCVDEPSFQDLHNLHLKSQDVRAGGVL